VPTYGLVGWWPFNGNANDESGNGNNGVVHGNVLLTNDRDNTPNSAYDWPNSNSGVNSSSFISLPNMTSYFSDGEFSISLWVEKYASPISGDPRIIGIGEWGLIFDQNSSSLKVYFGLGLDTPSSPIGENNWVNIVFTSNGSFGQSNFYLDGNLIHQRNTSANLIVVGDANSPWEIGRKSTPAFNGFGGKIDDIGIWNRALNPQEVAALYSGCQQSISVQPQSQMVIFNDNAQFTAASSDQSATYQWQTNLGLGFQNLTDAGQYSGSSTNTFNVSNVALSNNNQQFRCIVNSGSCTDTSDVALLSVVNNVGLVEQNQMQLFVYPNPTSSIITIENPQGLISSFVLVDAQGREVHSGTLNTTTTLNLNAFPTGIYTILFENKALREVKVVKE
jgi:hypothetical protein